MTALQLLYVEALSEDMSSNALKTVIWTVITGFLYNKFLQLVSFLQIKVFNPCPTALFCIVLLHSVMQ